MRPYGPALAQPRDAKCDRPEVAGLPHAVGVGSVTSWAGDEAMLPELAQVAALQAAHQDVVVGRQGDLDVVGGRADQLAAQAVVHIAVDLLAGEQVPDVAVVVAVASVSATMTAAPEDVLFVDELDPLDTRKSTMRAMITIATNMRMAVFFFEFIVERL